MAVTTLTINVPEQGTLTLDLSNIGSFTLAPGGPGPGGTMKNQLLWTIDTGAGIATIRFNVPYTRGMNRWGYPGQGYNGAWTTGTITPPTGGPALVMRRVKRRYISGRR